jgi:threonine dehydrogenase-like Zn-dependent dehydrogenase
VVAPVDIFWPRNVAQENFFFCFDSMTQRRAFLGYLYVLFWTLHVLWTSGVPMLAWCVLGWWRQASAIRYGLARRLPRGGHDLISVVEEAGPKSPFKVGDEVFGLNYQLLPIGLGKFQGTLQQFALVPEHEMWKKPESLNHTEAASLPLAGLTCLQAFDQHNLQAGQELLVVGASGGVGHVATAFASRLGVNVTGICSTANVQFVKECGAVRVLDYRAEEPIMEQVSAVTAEHGKFDIVFDTVSSADSRDKVFDFLSCQIGGQGTGRRPAPALPQRSSKQAATVHTAKADTEAALGV